MSDGACPRLVLALLSELVQGGRVVGGDKQGFLVDCGVGDQVDYLGVVLHFVGLYHLHFLAD